MAREILRPNVSLGFDDAAKRIARGMLPHQILTQKLLGNIDGGLFVKSARKFHVGVNLK